MGERGARRRMGYNRCENAPVAGIPSVPSIQYLDPVPAGKSEENRVESRTGNVENHPLLRRLQYMGAEP